MSLRKKVVAATLATGLVFSALMVVPFNTYNSGVVEASSHYGNVASRISDVYKMLETDELEALRNARNQITIAKVEEIIGNNQHISVTFTKKSELAEFFYTLAQVHYSSNAAELENALSSLNNDVIQELFPGVTSGHVYNFLIDVEDNLKSSVENLDFSSFISGGIRNNIQNTAKQALLATINDSDYSEIKAGLYNIFKDGEAEEGLTEILNVINTTIDPDGEAQIALGLAYIRTIATPKAVTLNVSSSKTFDLGIANNNVFNLGNAIEGKVYTSAGAETTAVTFEVVPSGLNKTGKITAVSANANENFELKIYFKHGGNSYLVAKVNITTQSSGSFPPPSGDNDSGTTTPPTTVEVPVSEKVETNENGQTTNTVEVDQDKVLDAIQNSEEPVNLVLKAKQDADVVSASLTENIVNAMNVSNPNHTVTLETPAGSVTVPVSELSKAFTEAAANGFNAADAEIKIIVEKGTEADQNELENQLGDASQPLTGLVKTTILVSTNDGDYEVSFYSTYVENRVVLEGRHEPSQIVGIMFMTQLGTNTAKSNTVAVAAASPSVIAVPTNVAYEDGKTIVTLKSRSNAPFTVVKTSKSFVDVSNQWFANDVLLLANKLLVNGVDDQHFAPYQNLTRAEFAAMIVRALGLPENVEAGTSFSDVKVTDWYAGVVGAAAQAKIIKGVGDGSFNPKGLVTRQEIAVMIKAAVEFAGGNATLTTAQKNAALAKFTDRDKVSSWALDAVAFAAANDILKGNDNKINPTLYANRAEAVTFVKRFMSSVGFITEK